MSQQVSDDRGARRIPVRLKLAATLVLPITLLVALGTAQVLDAQDAEDDARRDSDSVDTQADLAASATGPGSFLNVLVDERNRTAVYLLDAEDMISSVEPGQYLETRGTVDDARADFEAAVADGGEEVQEAYQPTLDVLRGQGPDGDGVDRLEAARAAVDEVEDDARGLENVEAVEDLFTAIAEVTDPLFEANLAVAVSVTDEDLRRGVAIVDQASRQTDIVSLLTYELAVAALAGESDGLNTPEEISQVATLLGDLRTGEDRLRLYGEGGYEDYVDRLFASEHTEEFPRLVEEALETGAPNLGGLFAAAGDQDAFGYDKLREAAEDEIDDTVAGAKEDVDKVAVDAERTTRFYLIVGLLVLAVVIVSTWAISLSITRPLRSLTTQASSMATKRLPRAVAEILDTPPGQDVTVPPVAPILVRTRDEVTEVAQALNTVQDSALDLAVEQAVMRRNIADSFVNLGRRNQTLLGRQLDFITELEHNETDPRALANLFRLDHLATRMRRNAESLLVLAGIEPPRKWTQPVRISDVIRASLGEVEGYERVTVRGIESATVIGAAAADIAHLLAELVENALSYSPPNQSVEIRGRAQPAGPHGLTPPGTSGETPDDGHYTVAVVDNGIGMPAEEIERANRRLAAAESFTVAPSRYLGHYVAGMIAARHGITVRLTSTPGYGVTATVTLPTSVLSDETPVEPSALSAAPSAGAAPVRRAELGRSSQEPSAGVLDHLTDYGAVPDDRQLATGTYRVGQSEFVIDLGTSLPAPQTGPGGAPRGGYEPEGQDPRPTLQPTPTPAVENQERTPSSVQKFLSTFATGLQEGRTEAARERGRGDEPTDHGGA